MNTQKFPHLMVDIETLSTKPYAVIVAIAAIEFNSAGETGRVFHENIDINSCLHAGLQVDGDTIEWWMKKSNKARLAVFTDSRLKLVQALDQFSQFFETNDYTMWSNAASFDLSILYNAYGVIGMPVPWKWYNERCVRTLSHIMPQYKKQCVFKGVEHNPVDDCMYQLDYTSQILRLVEISEI